VLDVWKYQRRAMTTGIHKPNKSEVKAKMIMSLSIIALSICASPEFVDLVFRIDFMEGVYKFVEYSVLIL
jgi:hypothetical protein